MGGVPSDKQPEKSVATLRGSVLVVGTLASFVLFGVAQEALTKTKYGKDEEKFGFTTFLVVLQSAGNALVAGMLLLVSYGSKAELTGGVPLKEWIIVALAYLGAHKFGLWSLLYIPFPLQVMTKSCKTVPVMLGEIILAGAKPGAQKIVSVLVMTAGIGIFLVYKPSKKGVSGAGLEMTADTALGLGLVLAALVCDGVYGPYQNRICKEAKAKSGEDLSPYHLMFNMNFYQGVFALVMVGGKVATGGKNELVSKVHRASTSYCLYRPSLSVLR
jgi:UDP-galactose transporter B1